jgi:hypothetical protein
MNGINEKGLRELDKYDTVEMVLEELGSMAFMARFKGLRSLTLVNCSIQAIEGLEGLTRLEEVWLNENQIS